MIAKRERLFTKAFPDSEMVLQVTSGSLFVQLQPLHLERHHNTAEDTVAQFHNGAAPSAAGPSCELGCCRGCAGGLSAADT